MPIYTIICGFYVGLSKIDLKVLDFICFNGAQMPEREIAERLRLKPGTVSYSLNKMLKEKSILGYRYRVNYARLGLGSTAWVFLRLRPSNPDSFQMLGKLLEFPQVHVVSFLSGDFDLAMKVIERDVFCIDAFVRLISQKFSDYIYSTEVFLVTKSYKVHNLPAKEQGCLCSLSETDLKILGLRMHFPEKTLGEIASELGIHRNTVSKRWKFFWKEGLLVKKTPVVSPDYYGGLRLALRAIILIDAAPEACDAIAKKLAKMDEVHELNSLMGRFPLMAIIRASDIPSFFDFIKSALFGGPEAGPVRKTVSAIVLRSRPHNSDYLPRLLGAKILRFRKGRLACNHDSCKAKA
jgi:DNA-binding Lrp family transcriptional regulator